jgi:hypothetical protein
MAENKRNLFRIKSCDIDSLDSGAYLLAPGNTGAQEWGMIKK